MKSKKTKDPLCICLHRKSWHEDGKGKCLLQNCCNKFKDKLNETKESK